jgi:signal transduction histidine kinase/streptogramin lyase
MPYQWPIEASSACEDHDGNLVLGTWGAGVFFVQTNGAISSLSTSDRLSANRISSVLVDREGNLWVGTDGGGLNRVVLKRQGFQTLEGSGNLVVQSVAEDAAGKVWIGGSHGFGLAVWDGTNVFRYEPGLRPEPIQCVFVDREQRVWVSSASRPALYQFQKGQSRGVNDGGLIQQTVQAIHQDHAGQMWFGTAGGLVRLKGGEWKLFTASDGLSSTNITAIADSAGGDIWVGTSRGGINRLQNGRFTVMREADGAPSDQISGLWVDEEDVLWVTTPAGLGRWHHGKWTRYTTRDGLVSDALGYLLDDGKGNLWIASRAGLFHVSKKALNEVANGAARSIPCRTFDKADGLPTRQLTFGSQPGAWRGRSNILWFATSKGVVSLNVARFRPNTNPPPVTIETVLVDDVSRSLSAGSTDLALRPADERLEIQYASLNLGAPERARFRYRLEGFENDWIEAGNTRIVRYTKLPAGQYTFQVKASNEDGVWNETGASLGIAVLPPPPPFWRTWWFLTFTPLALIAAIVGIVHYLSTQKLQRQLAVMRQQEALEKERARIARDIHDQVGASLTQLALLGELVETDKDSPQDVQSHAQQISQGARETTRALDEIVWTVNPQNDTLEGLVNYICKNAQDYLAVAGVRYRFDLPPQLPAFPIPPDVRHNVFLASKEAVTNVVRHAKATSAWVRMKLEDSSFTLEIEDNGRGVADLDVNAPRTRQGLKNMRKRMEEVGGSFSITPGSEGGALVRLIVPLPRRETAES